MIIGEKVMIAGEILSVVDWAGAECIFNMKNIAMMEFPLLNVEKAISELMREEEEGEM